MGYLIWGITGQSQKPQQEPQSALKLVIYLTQRTSHCWVPFCVGFCPVLAGQYDINHWDIKELLFPIKMHCFASGFQVQQLRKTKEKQGTKIWNNMFHIFIGQVTLVQFSKKETRMFDEKKSAAGLQSLFHWLLELGLFKSSHLLKPPCEGSTQVHSVPQHQHFKDY